MGLKRGKFKIGSRHHVFNRGNRKHKVFYDSRDRQFFIEKLWSLSFEMEIKIISFCLLVNHYHLALKQGCGESISKFMHRLITAYSVYVNKRHCLVGHTFQGRYKSKEIFTESSMRRVVEYIRKNPVKLKYVSDPEFYRWTYVDPKYEPPL